MLSWAAETSPGRRAERAVERATRALGIECEIVPCAYSLNGSRPLAVELLSSPDRPSALFCLSDSIAYGVYVACAELGLRIPEDVSVAGFDDHPISRLLQPPLTTTHWGAESVAKSATGFLIAALSGTVGDRHRLVEPALRPRASTGPPAQK